MTTQATACRILPILGMVRQSPTLPLEPMCHANGPDEGWSKPG
jgi:hypothetical protein